MTSLQAEKKMLKYDIRDTNRDFRSLGPLIKCFLDSNIAFYFTFSCQPAQFLTNEWNESQISQEVACA